MRLHTPLVFWPEIPFIQLQHQLQICRRIPPLHYTVCHLEFHRRINHRTSDAVPIHPPEMCILRVKNPREGRPIHWTREIPLPVCAPCNLLLAAVRPANYSDKIRSEEQT